MAEECQHIWQCYTWVFYEFKHRMDFYICAKCRKTKEVDHPNAYPFPGPPIDGKFYQEIVDG